MQTAPCGAPARAAGGPVRRRRDATDGSRHRGGPVNRREFLHRVGFAGLVATIGQLPAMLDARAILSLGSGEADGDVVRETISGLVAWYVAPEAGSIHRIAKPLLIVLILLHVAGAVSTIPLTTCALSTVLQRYHPARITQAHGCIGSRYQQGAAPIIGGSDSRHEKEHAVGSRDEHAVHVSRRAR